MPELFSNDWLNELQTHWNDEPGVKERLADIDFNAIVACGFKGDDDPVGVFVIEDGECVSCGAYNGEEPDWDMRASRKNWMKWVSKGIGLTGLGVACTTGKLEFVVGDYKEMIQNPKLGKAFAKALGLMKKIETE